MKKTLFFFGIALFLSLKSLGQTNKPLFTVNGKPVFVDEFAYIYTKTNGSKATYSRQSVEEYLDLYTKFKMKVARAHEMKLDTIPSLQEELAGYRRQLSDSYLTDREVTDKLVKEAYDRMTKDVDISHILIKVTGNDTSEAYQRAQVVRQSLDKGTSWEDAVKRSSEDTNSKDNGGKVGFLTAMMPDGFYALESAIYTTQEGKYSDVVRSPLGYHILKINKIRPARGEMEAAHILLRFKKEGVDQPNAKPLIDSLYRELQRDPANFDAFAARFSDDSYSAPRAGYLGFFGIGRYEPGFEDTAFGLTKDGELSAPFASSIGWHIIKRVSRRGIEPFDAMKSRLKAKIQRDSRFEIARQAMIERIKRENNFNDDAKTDVLRGYISRLDSSFLTYSWKAVEPGTAKLGGFGGDFTFTLQDFNNYIVDHPNNRVNYALQMNNKVDQVVNRMYGDYLNEKALAFEETQLDKKYPEFKNLMREYEEGILLFEAIKINVWDKASQDSVGLEKFFKETRDKYQWNQRAQLITYTLTDSAKVTLEEVMAYAAKNKPQKVLKKFNKKGEFVTFSEETVERGKSVRLPDTGDNWTAGKMIFNKEKSPKLFVKVEKLLAPGPKTLKEARGFVVADYQEYLEKKWMEELSAKYKVEINRDVLDSLIK